MPGCGLQRMRGSASSCPRPQLLSKLVKSEVKVLTSFRGRILYHLMEADILRLTKTLAGQFKHVFLA